jgi:hypothetical protein
MNRPEHSPSWEHDIHHLRAQPKKALLGFALEVARSIPNELKKSDTPWKKFPRSRLSQAPSMYRAKAFATVGAVVLESSGQDKELQRIGRRIVSETIDFVKRHVDDITSADMRDLLVPIAVASCRVQCSALMEQCIELGKTIVGNIQEPESEVTVGMSPFWRLAYDLADGSWVPNLADGSLADDQDNDRKKYKLVDRVLSDLMTPAARGIALAYMADELAKREKEEYDFKIVSYVMHRGNQCLTDLSQRLKRDNEYFEEGEEKLDNQIRLFDAIERLGYSLSSLYASRQMIEDVTDVFLKLPDGFEIGRVFGLAMATERNILAGRLRKPDVVLSPSIWFNAFKTRLHSIPSRRERDFERAAFALELVKRTSDVQNILERLPPSKDKEAGIDRYIAELVSADTAGIDTPLSRFPQLLRDIFEDEECQISPGGMVWRILDQVTSLVYTPEKQEKILTAVVEECRRIGFKTDEKSAPQSDMVRFGQGDEPFIAKCVDVLTTAGHEELGRKLFSAIPLGSEGEYQALTYLGDAAARSGDMELAESRYREAFQGVRFVPSGQNGVNEADRHAANSDAVMSLLEICSHASIHGCDSFALETYEKIQKIIQKVDSKTPFKQRFFLVDSVSSSFYWAHKRRQDA